VSNEELLLGFYGANDEFTRDEMLDLYISRMTITSDFYLTLNIILLSSSKQKENREEKSTYENVYKLAFI
jgi:hypothetical protein